MNDDSDTVDVVILKETDKAFLFQDKRDPSREAWFPKSEVYFERRNVKTGAATANIPGWLLDVKGWP